MSDPIENTDDVEDVLSSIRRLVSDTSSEKREPMKFDEDASDTASQEPASDALVLTSALRVDDPHTELEAHDVDDSPAQLSSLRRALSGALSSEEQGASDEKAATDWPTFSHRPVDDYYEDEDIAQPSASDTNDMHEDAATEAELEMSEEDQLHEASFVDHPDAAPSGTAPVFEFRSILGGASQDDEPEEEPTAPEDHQEVAEDAELEADVEDAQAQTAENVAAEEDGFQDEEEEPQWEAETSVDEDEQEEAAQEWRDEHHEQEHEAAQAHDEMSYEDADPEGEPEPEPHNDMSEAPSDEEGEADDMDADFVFASSAGADAVEEPSDEADELQSEDAVEAADPDLSDLSAPAVDEDMLRDLVAEIVREELTGELGERITRNVRKLVRREIHRAMLTQEFD